jgi:pyruvate ferredoxin oxidoreductase gamma subunit
MYRIRFHGRGGQGVKTASQILSSALFLEGLEVQDAPRYGAERRGAPIFAYVRADRAPINERGVIASPGLVVVVDETLVTIPAAGVLQGVDPDTVVLIHGETPPESWKSRARIPGTVLGLPAPARGGAHAEAAFAGARCAGAAAQLLGIVGRANFERALEAELGTLGANLLERNRAHALAAFDAMAPHAGLVREGGSVSASGYAAPEWIGLALEDAAVAVPDIRAPATSLASQTGLWRALRPVIDYGLCRRCSWICGTYCPDSAIRVESDGRPDIDYDHCKGCMLCVAVCPPHAIRAVPERQEAA